ncbi:hypothetical protein [Nocardiopsis sp. CNR-923]|uniref:hypothetical protein n=1 Tax=Nocardiopsis sp. CNR-923 TaxID=1904965 RepID=UPI000A8A56A5|nr:hypothetical protein [Nocardiopsis sp. CNR-923]
MGTLYPQEADLHSHLLSAGEEKDGDGDEPVTEENMFAEDPTSDANAWLPSSLGLSLFTDAPALVITCRGARYATGRDDGTRRWSRIPLDEETVEATESGDIPVHGGRALLRVRRRPYAGAWLVTVALVNAAVAEPPDRAGRNGHRPPRTDWDRMLFQSSFTVEPRDGAFLEYPGVLLTSRDPEEEELRLQYRHVRTFTVGHGCSVTEERSDSVPEDGPPDRIGTEVMPTEEVLRVRHAGPTDARALKLSFLSDASLPPADLARELSGFVDGYRNWYGERVLEAATAVPRWGQAAAERILTRIRTAIDRMEAGARLVCEDPAALAAFRTANQAMALQMRRGSADLAGTPRTRYDPLPQKTAPDGAYAWRPFQLGFFLLCVGGLIDPAHPDRESADVVWFPTGGGKTEAYLLLACFEMVLRRLRHGSCGGGTAVLSRYTLSLLTTQQFQRAGTRCALWSTCGCAPRNGPAPGSTSAPSGSPSACGWARPPRPTPTTGRTNSPNGSVRWPGRPMPSSWTGARGAAPGSCLRTSRRTRATTGCGPRRRRSPSSARARSATSMANSPYAWSTPTCTMPLPRSCSEPWTSSPAWPGRPGPDGCSAAVADCGRPWSSRTNCTC